MSEQRGLFARFRARMIGNRGPIEISKFGSMYSGPFASPPQEHIVLDPDLPWELRAADDSLGADDFKG
jgi:hypothetical protein